MFTDLLRRFAAALIPGPRPESQIAVTNLPPAVASSMDVDGLLGLMREAEGGNMDRMLRLYAEIWGGDTSIMACVWQRKTGLLGQPPVVTKADGGSPEAARHAELLRAQLANVSGLRATFGHLLDASIWPVAVARKVYAPSRTPGLLYDLVRLEPVPFYRLDFTGGGAEPAGTLRLKCVDARGQQTGATEPVRAVEYIVHRGHLLKTFPDTWGGPFRAALLWWFFATCTRQWWARNLNKFGTPFMVGRVASDDKRGKAALLNAFNNTSQMIGIVVSEETKLEVTNALSAASTDSFDRFHTLCRNELSKLITGQTMTTEGQAQGIGGTQANVQSSRLDDITSFDGAELGETFLEQVFRPWLKLNGLSPDAAPTLSWGAPVDDAAAKSTLVKTAHEAGLELTEEGVAAFSELAGLPFRRAGAAAGAPGLPGATASPSTASPAGGETAGTSEEVSPAQAALNGAQIKALLELANQVATGMLPYESGMNTARAAFPDIQEGVLAGIFTPLKDFRSTTAPGVTKFAAPAVAGLPDVAAARAANERLVEAGADKLAEAFSGDLAPIRRLLREASTAEAFEATVLAFYSDWSPARSARVIEEALAAHAANGILKTVAAAQ